MSPWTVASLNFRPMSRFASNQQKRVWRPITGPEKNDLLLYRGYIYVTSKITIFRLRLSTSLLKKQLTENCIWGIESDLVLRRVANESFRFSEGDITRSCSISLIISDYFNLPVLENTNTRIGSSKIDSYGWSRHFSAEKIKILWRHNSYRKMKTASLNHARQLQRPCLVLVLSWGYADTQTTISVSGTCGVKIPEDWFLLPKRRCHIPFIPIKCSISPPQEIRLLQKPNFIFKTVNWSLRQEEW